MPQRILDLAALPVLDVQRVLLDTIDQFRPTLLVFSWRDIQIYAPVDGRGGNPLQNSFEVFYSANPLKRLHGALGGLRLMTSHYGELRRNQRLVRQGLKRARRFQSQARAVLGGGAVSVFYEQLGRSLPKGTIVSVGEGEPLLEKLLLGQSLESERCFVVGEPPRPGSIHEQPESAQNRLRLRLHRLNLAPAGLVPRRWRFLCGGSDQARLPSQLLLLRLHGGGGQTGSPQSRAGGGQGDASALRPRRAWLLVHGCPVHPRPSIHRGRQGAASSDQGRG